MFRSFKLLSKISSQSAISSKSSTVIQTNRINENIIPKSVLLLGSAGLIPFLGTTLCAYSLPELTYLMQQIQSQYGATILSFMGGAHWGLAMANYGCKLLSLLNLYSTWTLHYLNNI